MHYRVSLSLSGKVVFVFGIFRDRKGGWKSGALLPRQLCNTSPDSSARTRKEAQCCLINTIIIISKNTAALIIIQVRAIFRADFLLRNRALLGVDDADGPRRDDVLESHNNHRLQGAWDKMQRRSQSQQKLIKRFK